MSAFNTPGRARVSRLISFIFLGLACGTAVIVIAMRVVHSFRPDLMDWPLKSAAPLMLAGAACVFLQFAVPRTRSQVVLGLMVSAAFILWGIEQYVADRGLASFIDDIVVFLFVLDVSLVIRGQLKRDDRTAEVRHEVHRLMRKDGSEVKQARHRNAKGAL